MHVIRTEPLTPAKHVVVLLRRPPQHPRTMQGLRAAVGYVLADLQITLVLCGPAAELISSAPPSPETVLLLRHLSTLRALGHRVVCASEVDVCSLIARADAAVSW